MSNKTTSFQMLPALVQEYEYPNTRKSSFKNPNTQPIKHTYISAVFFLFLREPQTRGASNNVEARKGRVGGEQVQDVAGSAGGGDGELCRQHGCEESLHNIGERNQRETQPTSVGLRRRHGHGHCQERKTRSEEKGHASCHRPPAQALAPKGRRLHVL